jgi:hypothetical protein
MRNLLVGNVRTAITRATQFPMKPFKLHDRNGALVTTLTDDTFFNSPVARSLCTISATRLNSSSATCLSGNISRRPTFQVANGARPRRPVQLCDNQRHHTLMLCMRTPRDDE